jgi:hypothetical protein
MFNTFRKKLVIAALFVIGIFGISISVYLSQQQQDTRTRASASTTLSYTPATSQANPQQVTVSNKLSFNVIISPGNNRPSLVRLELLYDSTKFAPDTNPFAVNTDAFPVTQEGPIVQNGKILISVSVGNDPSKAISTTTRVGTLNLIAKSPTGSTPSIIKYGPDSQVLSVASGDQASENVLSATSPAYVSIINAPTATPTNTPAPTPVSKGGDGGPGGDGGSGCGGGSLHSTGSTGSIGSNTTGGTGGTGGTGCGGPGLSDVAGKGGIGGLGSHTGPGAIGAQGEKGSGQAAGGGGGGGGGGAPGQPGAKGGDGGDGCGGPGEKGQPGEAAPNAWTGGKGGRGGKGGPGCSSSPTSTPTPSTPPTAGPTSLSLTVLLHGIGNSGDNANPDNFSLSNKNPLTRTRSVTVQVLDNANKIVASTNGIVTYSSDTGNFKGSVSLGSVSLGSGPFNVKVKENTHLRSQLAGFQNITMGTNNTLQAATLVAGDVNDDNALNILDYNLIIGCYSDLAPAVSCNTTNKKFTDLNDDGNVNQFDYNLFIRELSVQVGQ